MRRAPAAAIDAQDLAAVREHPEALAHQCDLVLVALARLRSDLAGTPLLAERLPLPATAVPPGGGRDSPGPQNAPR